MIDGLSRRTSSTSMRRCRRARGRKLVRKTSTVSSNRERRPRPSSVPRSMATDRFPRLADWKNVSTPRYTVWRPTVESPRYGSPETGCSTLVTCAPHSVSSEPAMGTNTCDATSTARTPASGASTRRSGGNERRRKPDAADLEEAEQPFGAELAPDAGLLEAAEGHEGERWEVAVDGDAARPYPPRHAESPGRVLGPDPSG